MRPRGRAAAKRPGRLLTERPVRPVRHLQRRLRCGGMGTHRRRQDDGERESQTETSHGRTMKEVAEAGESRPAPVCTLIVPLVADAGTRILRVVAVTFVGTPESPAKSTRSAPKKPVPETVTSVTPT